MAETENNDTTPLVDHETTGRSRQQPEYGTAQTQAAAVTTDGPQNMSCCKKNCWTVFIVVYFLVVVWVVIVTTLSFIPAFGDEDEWHKSTTGITYFVRLVNCEVDDPANSFGDCPHFLKKWDLYWIVGVSLAVIGAVAAGLHLARTLQGWQPWKSEATGSSGKTESIELEDLSRASATQTTDNANVQEVTNHSDAVEVPGEENNRFTWPKVRKSVVFVVGFLAAVSCFATPLFGGYCLVRCLHLKYAFYLSKETPRLKWTEYKALYSWIGYFGIVSAVFIPGLSFLAYLKKRGDWSLTILVPLVFDFVQIKEVSQQNGRSSHWWYISEAFVIKDGWKRALALLVFWGLAWVFIIAFTTMFTAEGIISLQRLSSEKCHGKMNSSWDCFNINTREGVSNCSVFKENQKGWMVCVRLEDISLNPDTGILKAAGIATGLLVFLKIVLSVLFRLLRTLSERDDRSKHPMPGIITAICGVLLVILWAIAEGVDCSGTLQVSFFFKLQLSYVGYTLYSIGILVHISDLHVDAQSQHNTPEPQIRRNRCKCCFHFIAYVVLGLIVPLVSWAISFYLDCHSSLKSH